METAVENKKLRVRVIHDSNAENPFTSWDCEPDLMCVYDRHTSDHSNGRVVEFIKYKPSNGQIIRHQAKICEILEIDLDYLKERELTKDEKADEIRWEISSSLSLEQLAKLCELFKIDHEHYTSRGYIQSDWADVLIVLTDEFYTRTGCDPKDAEKILRGSAKLYDAWAWGDVFGFKLEECIPMVKLTREDFNAGKFEEVEEEDEWNLIDSCWGFYGNDFETNGMKDHLPKEVWEQLKDVEVEYRY